MNSYIHYVRKNISIFDAIFQTSKWDEYCDRMNELEHERVCLRQEYEKTRAEIEQHKVDLKQHKKEAKEIQKQQKTTGQEGR